MTASNSERFSVLDPGDVEAIRGAALRTLERVGVTVSDPAVRDLLHDAGARVSADRVMLPGELVIDALAKAPREVKFCSRDGQAISSKDGFPYHGPAPSAVAVLEYGGGRHASAYHDVADLTRLADALPGIDFISPPAIAQDCPEAYAGLLTAEATFCNTQKFCLAFALDWGEARAWLAMAEHAFGPSTSLADRPVVGFAISPISPLVLAKGTSDILVGAAERGVPIVTVPGGMAGATSPYTIAGTLVVEHAEALLAITIAQLVRPGTPCVLGLATAVMDMASGNISLGMAERTLILNTVTPLARAWGLPGYAPVGLTDSFSLDEQAGAEKMLSIVTHLMSGLEFGSGVGRYEGGLSASYEGMLLDHELLQLARRHVRGIRVDKETLAEEVIAKVGPGGDFLGEAHTLQFLRSDEFLQSDLLNRRAQDSGGRPAAELAHQKVQDILSSSATPVPEAEQEDFKLIIAEHTAQLALGKRSP
jgi:trimethylamine--corrinoid protein Co-methyltransferase